MATESGVFLDLVSTNLVGKVTLGIERAVLMSFEEDQSRLSVIHQTQSIRITQDEVKRRSEICMRIFKQLRGDLKWGVERIVDALGLYLRCELDGLPWSPSERTVWTPEG